MDKPLTVGKDGKWNTEPPVADDKLGNINCHKFTLYVIGKISWEEMVADNDKIYGAEARAISDIQFIQINSLASLLKFASECCKIGEFYVAQILDANTDEMAHSFILKQESLNNFICYEKQGFKYPFTVQGLETILDFVNKDGVRSNENQKWRFVPQV